MTTIAHLIREECRARGWSSYLLCRRLDITEAELEAILQGAPLADWACKALARVFGTSVELWFNLQVRQDAQDAMKDERKDG